MMDPNEDEGKNMTPYFVYIYIYIYIYIYNSDFYAS